MSDLNRWMQKHNLCPENILYLYRSDRKTVLHRMDGGEAALYAPMNGVLSVLPEDQFLNISKGIAVNRSQIVNIGNDGVYTMSDGRTFQGRKRGLSSHRRLRTEIGLAGTKPHPLSMLEKMQPAGRYAAGLLCHRACFQCGGTWRGFHLPVLQCGNGSDGRCTC